MILDNNVEIMEEDEIINYATEILDAVDNNRLEDGVNNGVYTYANLIALFLATSKLDNGAKLYSYCYEAAIKCGESNVRNKILRNEKIKVVFLPISAAEWPAEYIYRAMENNEIFEPVVVPVPLIGRSRDERNKVYNQTYSYFEDNNYNLKKVYNPDTEEITGWDTVGGFPDIVIHVTPWYLNMAKEYQITNLPLSVLNISIAYGFNVATSVKGDYEEECVYNKEFFNLMWRVYTETEKDIDGYRRYELLAAENVRMSGYIKMDYFYNKHIYSEDIMCKLWKIPEGRTSEEYKKVIIAPHFSIGDDNLLSFSTFDKNMWFYLYLAEKYNDSVSFVFKPHPNLRNALISKGIMKSIDEYEQYLDMFRRLPNADVIEEGDYLALFDTSDALINDSISFICEYMYVNKPMLFLRREEQRLTELGNMAVESQYNAGGRDYMAIDKFISEVVISGKDYKKAERERVFEQELDYVRINGRNSAEYVYGDIVNSLGLRISSE